MPIPFEAQIISDGQRTCGAAALNMVYRSFGLEIPQPAIWRVISLPDAFGGRFARTYRVAFDPLLRGVHAIAFRALDPVHATQSVLSEDLRVIMNHRLSEDTSYGHYTVALAANESEIELHDPELGPSQRRSADVMRSLWQPRHANCEITGNFLIALTARPAPCTCTSCGTQVPDFCICPACHARFALQPASALGCSSARCPARLWESVLCPFCDAAFAPV